MYNGMIEEFDNRTALAFKDAVQKSLNKVANDFGVTVKIDNVALRSRNTMSMSMTSSVGLSLKLEETPSGRKFLSYCEHYDIPKSALGQTFKFRNEIYRIVGWSPTARRYKVAAERVSDEKVYRFEPSHVKGMLR